MIDGRSFFDIPIDKKQENYENFIEIGKNNDNTTENLLHHKYFSKHYRLIAINLSTQIELENPNVRQQINFVSILDTENVEIMFLIIEKSKETTCKFLQNAVTIM